MIKKIFLIGTCRIHRPFGCDYPSKKPEKYDNYNVLNLWGSYNFLGPKYDIKEIKQFIDLLTNNNPIELCDLPLKNIFNSCFLDNDFNKQIEDTRIKFNLSDIVIVEVSSIKNLSTIINNKEIFLNLNERNLSKLKNYQWSVINEVEFIEYIKNIIDILNKYNKKVLFVTHFNHNNIKERETISNILKNNLPKINLFDPSKLVIDNLPNSIVDNYHYSKEFELLIMDEINNFINNL
jgi:hypothetical protein